MAKSNAQMEREIGELPLCNCKGCVISRNYKSGYQPCHKMAPKNATPPGKE